MMLYDNRLSPPLPPDAALYVVIRGAVPQDRDRLGAMYDRCGPMTRYRRWGGRLRRMPGSYLGSALAGDPDTHDALVAEVVSDVLPGGGSSQVRGELVALASAARMPGIDEPVVDIGLLVEDRWQRRGIGRLMFCELVRRAAGRGMTALNAQFSCETLPVAARLGVGMRISAYQIDHGVVQVTCRIGERRPG